MSIIIKKNRSQRFYTVDLRPPKKESREKEFYDFFMKKHYSQSLTTLPPQVIAYKIDKDATVVAIDTIAIKNKCFGVIIDGDFIQFKDLIKKYYIEDFDNQECFETEQYQKVKFSFKEKLKNITIERLELFTDIIGYR